MMLSQVANLTRKVLPLKKCGVVIVAAGSASRMGGIDKIMAPLGGELVILRTVRAFQECEAICEIVVVTREDLILPVTQLCGGFDKIKAVVAGGSSRQESVIRGLGMLSGKMKLAAVHDGARPLISGQVIDRTVRAAHSYGAAAPAIPVKDTIKTVQGGLNDGAALTDDCSAVERLGMKIKIVEGDERNLKITTPLDLKIAEILLEEAQ